VLNIKFGRETLFSKTEFSKMLGWIAMNVAVSCIGLYISMEICKWRYGKVKKGEWRKIGLLEIYLTVDLLALEKL
jgi:hypothetical protein